MPPTPACHPPVAANPWVPCSHGGGTHRVPEPGEHASDARPAPQVTAPPPRSPRGRRRGRASATDPGHGESMPPTETCHPSGRICGRHALTAERSVSDAEPGEHASDARPAPQVTAPPPCSPRGRPPGRASATDLGRGESMPPTGACHPPAVRACHPHQHAARRSKPVGAMLSRRSGAPATRSRVSMRATPDPLHGSRPPSMLTPRRGTCEAVRTRPRAAVRACHPRKHATRPRWREYHV